MSELLASPPANLLDIDQEITEYFARVFRQLREKGSPIPTNDLWIAPTALRHGYVVFTLAHHLELLENLLDFCPPDLLA